MSRTEIATQIRNAVAAVVKQPEFAKWVKAEQVGDGLILLNNSFISRQNIKTAKSGRYLAIPVIASQLGVSSVVVVRGIAFNTDFKFVDLKGIKKLGLEIDEIPTAIDQELAKLGRIVMVLIGD